MTDADPVVWLRAALDAAERGAQAAAKRAWSPHWEYDSSVRQIRDLNNGNELANIYFPEIGNFSAANDPAAVLRRITADRKILAEHTDDGYGSCKRCAGDHEDDCECGTVSGYHLREHLDYPCATMRLLAEGYGWTEETT